MKEIVENSVFTRLTVVRFGLALWVLLFHLHPVIQDFYRIPSVISEFLAHGYYAVDLFFIISGIVITHIYGESLKQLDWPVYREFLWRRFARLYPLHLFTLLGLAIMVVAGSYAGYKINQPHDYTVAHFVENLFLVQAWHFPNNLSWNQPAWSISCEWLMYIIAPILFYVLLRPYNRITYLLIAVSVLSLTALVYAMTPYQSFSDYAVWRAFGGFVTGICIHQIAYDFLLRGQKRNWLDHPVLLYLGHVSYTVYMVQFPLFLPIRKLWPHDDYITASAGIKMLYLGSIIMAVLITAIIVHHVIEKSARLYLQRRDPFRR